MSRDGESSGDESLFRLYTWVHCKKENQNSTGIDFLLLKLRLE